MGNNKDFITKGKECSAAFTGHRSLPFQQTTAIKAALLNLITEWHTMGITNYYCGMAWGFDLLAAECVLLAKRKFPDITLTAVIPYREQCALWQETSRRRYRDIVQKADNRIILSENYYKGCLLVRNDFMLDHASRLVAYYNGDRRGGTAYTFNRARLKGIPVTNLYGSTAT